VLSRPVDCLLECREVAFDDLQDTVDVDPEVLVGDQVAKAGDVGPWDFRMPTRESPERGA
jgi:hypothetical protein